MKILTIVGARPQFIKAAPLSRELARSGIEESLLHTGQHYDPALSDVFFGELSLPKPEFQFEVGSGSHGMQTGRMLEQIEEILLARKFDAVLVYGDTNSTLAGALAAAKLHVPVIHVEAGLRSWNRTMPEEVNRVLTDHMSSLLFCPTFRAVENLRKEGIDPGLVHHVGDVMLDAALTFGDAADRHGNLEDHVSSDERFVLVTVHRPDNADRPAHLRQILEGLNRIGETRMVIFPVHPRTRKQIEALEEPVVLSENVHLVEPFSFFTMIQGLRRADVLITDSGGLQKEAYFHRTPCVTIRPETEWTETVEAGWNHLVAADAEAIVAACASAGPGTGEIAEYGDGDAAEKMVKTMSAAFS